MSFSCPVFMSLSGTLPSCWGSLSPKHFSNLFFAGLSINSCLANPFGARYFPGGKRGNGCGLLVRIRGDHIVLRFWSVASSYGDFSDSDFAPYRRPCSCFGLWNLALAEERGKETRVGPWPRNSPSGISSLADFFSPRPPNAVKKRRTNPMSARIPARIGDPVREK